MSRSGLYRWLTLLSLLGMVLTTLALPAQVQVALAVPTKVVVAGNFQSELGDSDWNPASTVTQMSAGANDGIYRYSATIPNGNWEYKITENDGARWVPDGPNRNLNGNGSQVRFYYDASDSYIADSRSQVIAAVAGSFQSELGCSGDWQPWCLRSWLKDSNGDGIYTFETTAIPVGSYEFKVALNESWDVNYPANNLSFSVPNAGMPVRFSFAPNNGNAIVVSVGNTSAPDNNVEWDGLRHDSRDMLYRTPGGAVPTGTPVTIRFRTFHNDVTAVRLRVYDLNANNQRFYEMTPAATDVSCYQSNLTDRSCDFWAATITSSNPNNLWYRFIIVDGTDTDYYADNTAALDGGLGRTSDDLEDRSYALMFYDPAFSSPDWAKSAVIYQIFPDRFRNGDTRNDPRTGDSRYDDPVIALDWNALPEGYCRHYSDANTNCPWRFDTTPPSWSPTIEGPRGRDYFGGDLRGVTQRLDYLKQMGVTAIYFNPIFAAKSNHRYDTADYYQIDPALGTLSDFRRLVSAAEARGIRVILDNVFNHMSSDSAFFDRYGYYSTVGACEASNSPYRSWFNFRAPGANDPSPCAPSTAGGNDTYYNGWFGFDSIPEIRKTTPAVQDYFLTGSNSVSRYWLKQGAAGWRLDVMGDASFPAGYWETFRQVVHDTRSDSLIIGELWQKDSTLLRHLRGQTADTTMNYRLRDAVLGLLAPGNFDAKGFGDSGRSITPSEFANRIAAIREDYPDAAFYTLMNLLGSHDTERILWTLTPGPETRADKEFNAANLAEGKRRLQVASLIQFTMPGAPTVYYGDEVGVTGDDDPDDRRTYPWSDTGGRPDNALLSHYRELAKHRNHFRALTAGDLQMLLADDANGTVAYGRKLGNDAALVVVNRSNQTRTIDVPVAGYIPNDTRFAVTYCVANANIALWHDVKDGALRITLEPMSAALLTSYQADLTAPAAPSGLQVTNEGDAQISLSWNSVSDAAGYNVYRSPVSGGGWVKVNASPLSGTSFTDTGLRNARLFYYVVRAVDSVGNESASSSEVTALPRYQIGWANLQWPPTLTHTISPSNRTASVYGQVWINGATSAAGPTQGLIAQLGYGPVGSNPATSSAWIWVDAVFNVDAGNNDEFVASLLPETTGTFDYVYRYSTTAGRDWLYADRNGPVPSGNLPPNPGKLTVNSSGDTSAPSTPTGLNVVSASPGGITLNWNAASDNVAVYGYEVRRSATAGGPYTRVGISTSTSFTDNGVSQSESYFYVVRAIDTSFNRSGDSNEVRATADLRVVTVTFNVTVPTPVEDAVGRSVYIAGSLNRLIGGLPEWNAGGVVLTQVSPTQWTITLSGLESTQIEYKYTLGLWDYVEKDGSCGEIPNRTLTLSYGSTGTMQVNETVPNWRNVEPCGN